MKTLTSEWKNVGGAPCSDAAAGKVTGPLAKTERMVIINAGNGPGGGASKVTGDVTQIMSQLPPVIESLTGIKFEKLLEQIPALRKAMGKGTPET